MNNKAIISILCIALAAFMTFSYFLYRENNVLSAERDSLYIKVEKYEKTDGSSFVVSRISKQMEDIAYQQMEISNKRREEALFQMTIADQMRSKAESEQRKAQEFAENAAEARNMAEQQRELAVVQQKKAEYARNIADTLSFIALGSFTENSPHYPLHSILLVTKRRLPCLPMPLGSSPPTFMAISIPLKSLTH